LESTVTFILLLSTFLITRLSPPLHFDLSGGVSQGILAQRALRILCGVSLTKDRVILHAEYYGSSLNRGILDYQNDRDKSIKKS